MGHQATIIISSVIFMTISMDASPNAIDLELVNESTNARREVVRVSLPVPRGAAPLLPTDWLTVDGKPTLAQARVVTRYPDRSPRRIILSFLAELASQQRVSCRYDPHSVLPIDSPLNYPTSAAMYVEEGNRHILNLPRYVLSIENDHAIVKSKTDGRSVAVITAYGPELSEPKPAKTAIVENGTRFVWLRWIQQGSNYNREVDFQVDCLGRIKLTQRILRHLPRNGWTPDFGFRLTATEAEPVQVPTKPVHFLQFNPKSMFSEHPELIASLKLTNGMTLSMANPLALRQNRGTLEADVRSDETTVIRAGRIEPIEDESNRLMIQEGMWRVTEVILFPEVPEILAACIDQPLVTKVNWRAYDRVYNTGPPLDTEHSLLKKMIQRATDVLEKMSINGDDWGNITSYDPATGMATINSMLRFNHCQYVWEDYFRTGDSSLRRIAVDWSGNYRNFSVYWGPRERFFGGGRSGGKNPNLPGLPHGPGTYMERQNNAVDFCTKGFQNFWLTYEETGDPRFKEVAEAQAKWSAQYVHSNKGQMRNIGVVTDFIKLYEYTGEPFYLDQAIRLWEEFKSKQCPDLLFTQSGAPATGNDLFIRDDGYGYRHPFYKAYMVWYATKSLPYLLKHRPNDQRLRDTILACNNWLAKVQTPGGGWSYPGPTSPGMSWIAEYCYGLMLAHEISPNEAYLDAVQRGLSPIIALYEKYSCLPINLVGWETAQSQTDILHTYRLGTDRNRLKDFTHGKVNFLAWPESVAYLQVALRDYLRYRSESSLLIRDKFVEQIVQLPSNLPKDRVRHEEQGIDNQIIHTSAQSSKPPLTLPEAASIGDVNLVKVLIEKGPAFDGKENSFFNMPLHRAALGGHKEVVELLLSEGADISARDSFHASALHYAVERGHKEVVEVLLAKGADVNIKNSEGQTALDIAVNQNRKQIAESLIVHGSDVNTTRRYPPGDTPLHVSVRAGQKEVVELLIAKGADVNPRNEDGQTPLDIALTLNRRGFVELLIEKRADVSLHMAARHGLLKKLKDLVGKGADVNAKNTDGDTPLHSTARAGHKDVAELLIAKGANVNVKNDDGESPLEIAIGRNHGEISDLLVAGGANVPSIQMAAQLGDVEKVKAFLKQGKDINARDKSNRTALHEAVRSKHKDVAAFLIEQGADVNAKGKGGNTPLYSAIWNADLKMIELLISRGADINYSPGKDYPPLHYAVWMENTDIARVLLDHGANCDAKDQEGKTAFRHAIDAAHRQMVDLFVAKGANVNARGQDNSTPLHQAVMSGRRDIVEILLANGADATIKDGHGRTALSWALERGHADIVELLKKHGAKE